MASLSEISFFARRDKAKALYNAKELVAMLQEFLPDSLSIWSGVPIWWNKRDDYAIVYDMRKGSCDEEEEPWHGYYGDIREYSETLEGIAGIWESYLHLGSPPSD